MSLKGCTEKDFEFLADAGITPGDGKFMSVTSESEDEERKKLNHKIMVREIKKAKGVPEVLIWPSG